MEYYDPKRKKILDASDVFSEQWGYLYGLGLSKIIINTDFKFALFITALVRENIKCYVKASKTYAQLC